MGWLFYMKLSVIEWPGNPLMFLNENKTYISEMKKLFLEINGWKCVLRLSLNATNCTKKEGRAVDFFLLMDLMRNNKHCRINRTLSIPITKFLICVSELGLGSTLIEIIKFCPKIMKSFLIFRDWILFWFKSWLIAGVYLSKVNIWTPNISNNLKMKFYNIVTTY